MAVRALRLPRGIRQRGSSFLVDVSIEGKRKTATVHSLEEALAKQKELKGETEAKPSWTLQEAFDVTLKLAEPQGWRGSRSEKTSRKNAQAALDFFGVDKRLEDITVTDLDAYTEHLEELGNKNGTINRKIAALSKMLTVASKRVALSKPPMPRLKEGLGRIRYLTKEEEAALLSLLIQWSLSDHVDAVTVLVDTGMRVGELLRLEVRDVQFETGMIHIWETKGDLPRSIPMTERVNKVLAWRATKATAAGEPKLFPYTHHWLRHTWDRARAVMGFADDKQFVPHALRHTTASRLVQRGVPLKVVQEWMGHKTITITMRYAHLAPINLMNARDALEDGNE